MIGARLVGTIEDFNPEGTEGSEVEGPKEAQRGAAASKKKLRGQNNPPISVGPALCAIWQNSIRVLLSASLGREVELEEERGG